MISNACRRLAAGHSVGYRADGRRCCCCGLTSLPQELEGADGSVLVGVTSHSASYARDAESPGALRATEVGLRRLRGVERWSGMSSMAAQNERLRTEVALTREVCNEM